MASLAVCSSSLSNSTLSVKILEFLYRLYASTFVGCFNSKSRLHVDSFSCVTLSVYLASSISAWQLSRQFAIVLRFKLEKIRYLLNFDRVASLGREAELRGLYLVHSVAKRVLVCD